MKNKISVAMLTTSYPSYLGDLRGIFIYKLVKSLKNYINVNLITLKGYDSLISGAGIIEKLNHSWMARFIFSIYFIHLYLKILFNVPKCDIIHANWGLTAFLALLTKPFYKRKILLTERSSFMLMTDNKFLIMLNKFIYSHVDSLVLISNFSKKLLYNKYNINNVKVIMNGVDNIEKKDKNSLRTKLKLLKADKIFLYVGRIDEKKGIQYLIEAFNKIVLEYKNVYLIIIGRGDYAERLKLDNEKIIFLGEKLQNEVFDYMLASDVFVLPSLNETGGNVLLEARSCGLPIISTKVGWAEDLINDSKDGFFINKQDPKDIYNKIIKILDNKTFSKLLKNSKNIKLNDWDDCAKAYAKEYKRLIHASKYD